MNVTKHAKNQGQLRPELVNMSCGLPVATYELSGKGKFRGSSVQLGLALHDAFHSYSIGKWVSPFLYGVCRTIEVALSDFRVVEVHSETRIKSGGLIGQPDLFGMTREGRPVVVELKATLGAFALRPRACEVAQILTYADMLGFEEPLMLCLRASLGARKLNVFEVETKISLLIVEVLG